MSSPIQCVLIANHLTPGDPASPYLDQDGGAFVCTDYGTARDFKTVEAAQAHIENFRLNQEAPTWGIFLLTEVPVQTQGVR